MPPRAQPLRRDDQPAFVLHAYPYRETSLIVEAFTPDFGRVRYLAPALSMSETPPRWDVPPAKHGTHEPVWEPR